MLFAKGTRLTCQTPLQQCLSQEFPEMLPGCWLPSIFQPFAQIQHLYSNKTTLSPLIQHVVSAAMRVNLVSQQRTHKLILGAFFFILEIALIASNRAPQSRFITPVLTLLAGLPHQHLDPQKCFRSLLELVPREETWQCRSGTRVISLHLDSAKQPQWFLYWGCTRWHRLSSLSRCHAFPGGRQGAGGAYVREADNVDSDPLPSMLSCGGWQTCSQLEEWITLTRCQRVWWLTHAKTTQIVKTQNLMLSCFMASKNTVLSFYVCPLPISMKDLVISIGVYWDLNVLMNV